MKRYLFLAVLFLSACSREQTNAATAALGDAYNRSYRDNVIKNWQAKVSASQNCGSFKDRFKAAGERFDSAANGAFANDMMKIWDDAKRSGCAAQV